MELISLIGGSISGFVFKLVGVMVQSQIDLAKSKIETQQAADDSSMYQRELWKQKTDEALEKAQQEGVEVFYPDQEPFRKFENIGRLMPLLGRADAASRTIFSEYGGKYD